VSVLYPPPMPLVQVRTLPVRPLNARAVNTPLPAAPAADVELPMLVMAPMLPPKGRQL